MHAIFSVVLVQGYTILPIRVVLRPRESRSFNARVASRVTGYWGIGLLSIKPINDTCETVRKETGLKSWEDILKLAVTLQDTHQDICSELWMSWRAAILCVHLGKRQFIRALTAWKPLMLSDMDGHSLHPLLKKDQSRSWAWIRHGRHVFILHITM